jgi:NAD dependent epimerase/dehydratase family
MSDLGRLAGVKTGAYRPDMNVDFPGFRRAFVNCCAGFIGSNVADRLLAAGVKVVGYDDLSTGMLEFLATAQRNPGFKFVRGDVLDEPALRQAMAGADVVFHSRPMPTFASGSNIRARTSIRTRSRRSTC